MRDLLIIAVLAIAISTTIADWSHLCKPHPLGRRINHPDTCEKFIVCIGGGEVMDCPPRTHFNKELEVCDWPERAGCEDGSHTTSSGGPTSSEGTTSSGGPTSSEGSSSSSGTSQGTTSSGGVWGKYCKGLPLGKRINHPDTCEKFIVCIGGGEVMNCPPRTHFNKELEVCDWPERAGCEDGSHTTSSGGPTSSEGTTSSGGPTSSEGSSSSSGTSQGTTSSGGVWGKYCKGLPLGKRINHPDTCEKFIVCIGGGEVMDCPPKTHFNKELEVCDWYERAGCQKI